MADTAKAGAKKSRAEPRVLGARTSEQKPLPLGPVARLNARVVFALVLVALALWTASSFLPPLIWASILAVALWPLYFKFSMQFMAGPSASAAFVFTVLVALILVTPISLAVYTIAQQSNLLIDWLKRAQSKCRIGSFACPSRRKAWSSGGESTSRTRKQPRPG